MPKLQLKRDWRDDFPDWSRCPHCDKHVYLETRLPDGDMASVNVWWNGDLFVSTPKRDLIEPCGTPANAASLGRYLFKLEPKR